MKQTLAQKILQKHTDEEITADGQIVNCRLDLVLANDITGPLAIKGFKAMGATKVFDKDKVALVMDHFTPQKDIASANQVMISRRFAAEQNITHYYEGGNCGVEHTLLPEQGLVAPGDLVIGADSHTCTYGGISAFSTGMGSTDLAAGMALGETWFKVPPTIRVNITGTPDQYLRAKDLMLILIHRIGVDGARYKALEFGGSVIDNLPVEGRLTMANMAIEAGGKVGLFPCDEHTLAYCHAHRRPDVNTKFTADPGCVYESVVDIDVTGQEPVVACPHIPSREERLRTQGREGRSGGHRLLHQRPLLGYARRGQCPARPQGQQGRALHHSALHSRSLAQVPEGRPHGSLRRRRLHHRPLHLRPLPRRPHGLPRRWRALHFHHQQKLPRPHGQP